VVELAIEDDLHIVADPDVTRRLVAELLDNALRYGGSHSPVFISATCDSESFMLKVCDGGDGIPAAQLEAALRPFGRLVAEDARHVGMGLNYCVRIAELWAGELTFKQLQPGFEVAPKVPQQGFVSISA
jgi:K+-sensing histidine kinase KdpD